MTPEEIKRAVDEYTRARQWEMGAWRMQWEEQFVIHAESTLPIIEWGAGMPCRNSPNPHDPSYGAYAIKGCGICPPCLARKIKEKNGDTT